MKVTIDVNLALRMLTVSEALDLLQTYVEGRKKRIHTFTIFMNCLMGCAMDLTEVKKRLKLCEDGEIYINDKVTGHGVVFIDHKNNQWLYLETDSEKYEAIRKLKKLDKPSRPMRYKRK